ncbi:MAG: A24 family peptidase [Phycisphaerae bacterium]
MWALTLWNEGSPSLQWGVVISVSLLAAVVDVAWRRIPNLLVGPIWVGGLVWAAWLGGPPALGDAFVAGVMLATPYILLFLFAGGGAGDAKLMGAIGTWLGLVNGTVALFCVSLAGIVVGIAFALAKKRLRTVWANLAGERWRLLLLAFGPGRWRVMQDPLVGGDLLKMPYGVAIFAGVCAAAAGVLLWRA